MMKECDNMLALLIDGVNEPKVKVIEDQVEGKAELGEPEDTEENAGPEPDEDGE